MRSTLALASALLAAGCATFDAPPEASIADLDQGQLANPESEFVVTFDKTPIASTVKLELAPFKLDDEGNLADEDSDPKTELGAYFTYDGKTKEVTGATVKESDGGKTLSFKLDKDPPVGLQLVLIVEPGLADHAGSATHARRRIVFNYATGLSCNQPVSVFKPGAYFFLSQITQPLKVPVALFATIEIDPATGAVNSRFTKAHRNPDPGRCKPACASTEVCRLVPTQQCVAPSEPAASVDGYTDYVPDPDPHTGFGFDVVGCVADQDETSTVFTTAHVDVIVQQPPVTLHRAQLTCSFTPDAAGVLRGTGSLTAEKVTLGVIDSGKGVGDLQGRSIDASKVPAQIPGP
jgi:hypothetical protein